MIPSEPYAQISKIKVLTDFETNFFFFKDFIYLFMRVTERERGGDIGRGRSRLPARSSMWDLIPDPRFQNHTLSQRQTLNH